MMKTYYMLTKPGIIMGNVVTTASGFTLASRGHPVAGLFLATMAGLSLIIASAGVFNNYIDRAADAKMDRTKDRPLAKGIIGTRSALLFASLLGIAGVITLSVYTNPLTVFTALSGFFIYLVLYAFMKYRSFYGTLVGSLAGGIPPVVGYCAVTNRLDGGAALLFLILVLWQMPHFFAIAIYRLDDYAAGSIPVLPLQKGMYATKVQMLLYIAAFSVVSLLPTLMGYTGYGYSAIAALLGAAWFVLCLQGFKIHKSDDRQWAKQMFRFSLVVIMGICLAIPFNVVS